MTSQAQRAYQIADEFRRRGKKVVLGGIHPTVLPAEAKTHADAVVIGEAEEIWERLLDDCQKGSLEEFYKSGRYPDRTKLVVPRWENANLKIYPRSIGARLPMMPIFTTRGCPMGCSFCSVTKYFGKEFRMKPVEHVMKEIDAVGARYYFLVDDNIACNADYCRELFAALRTKRVKWFSQISTTVLKTPDLIEKAAEGGCVGLLVGFESISTVNLEAVGKRFNKVEQYEELISRMRKVGISPFASFIFGFDEDTVESFRLTIDFIRRNRICYVTFFLLTPLPGTEVHDRMKAENRLLDHPWSRYNLCSLVFRPRLLSVSELETVYWNSFKKLYTLKRVLTNTLREVAYSKTPVFEFFESLFTFMHFREKIRNHDHPLAGGIGIRR